MKHFITAIIFAALFVAGQQNASAQQWKGVVTYRGYYCYMLGEKNNPQVLVGKGNDSGGYDMCYIKFRSPFRWNDTGTACVKVIMTQLSSGDKTTQDAFCHYKDGWIYLGHYFGVDKSRPWYNYIVTVYRDNDFGRSGAPRKTLNLHLDKLNTSRLPFSNKAFDIYW